MNRRIYGEDCNAARVFDAEEIGPDDWRGWDIERSQGICIYTYQHIITRLADLIGGKKIYRLLVPVSPHTVQIDGSGNTWLDQEYLAPHQYLPRLIPPAADDPA